MPKSSLPASLSLALQERARAYGLPPLMTRGAFFKVRDQKWKEIQDIKRTRRLQLGPFASVYFENMQTMWWQIQEMLRALNIAKLCAQKLSREFDVAKTVFT